MKSFISPSKNRAAMLAAIALFSGLQITAHAVPLQYDYVGGDQIWDDSLTTTFNVGGTPTAWVNGNDATFNTPGTQQVTLGSFAGGLVSINKLEFGAAGGTYTFDNDVFNSGSGATIQLTGPGIVHAPGNLNPQVVMNSGELQFLNSATSGTANLTVQSSGLVTYKNSSSAGQSILQNNGGTVSFEGTSSGGTSLITNGGIVDISGHNAGVGGIAGVVSLSGINNLGTNGFAGSINVGSNQLTLNNLTLSSAAVGGAGSNGLSFALTSPDSGGLVNFPLATTPSSSQGRIIISGGAFTSTLNPNGVELSFSSGGPVAEGTYTLIDWTGAAATNLDINAFHIASLPDGVSRATLQFSGNSLVLVTVPEPATLAMPLAACLGLLSLRRRASRAAAPATV